MMRGLEHDHNYGDGLTYEKLMDVKKRLGRFDITAAGIPIVLDKSLPLNHYQINCGAELYHKLKTRKFEDLGHLYNNDCNDNAERKQ